MGLGEKKEQTDRHTHRRTDARVNSLGSGRRRVREGIVCCVFLWDVVCYCVCCVCCVLCVLLCVVV